MPSNRHLRRQLRRARRLGVRPVVVLDPGERFNSPAQTAARLVWLYRSELAPFLAAGLVLLAGWFAHARTPHLWPAFIIGSAVAAWVLVTFGAQLGLPRLAGRAYAGACIVAAGGWVAYAAVVGPLAPPLPPVLGAVALLLAVPWWADHRRQARARLVRVVAAWPDTARNIGLPASAIQAVRLEAWGWRAWLQLANGQTIADVTGLIPAIESALGTSHGAVRVYRASNGKANWCEIHVLGDPPAELGASAPGLRVVGAESEQFHGVVDGGEPGLRGNLLRPLLDHAPLHLDADAALAAGQVVVVGGGSALPVQRLAGRVADGVDRTLFVEYLQVAVHGGEADGRPLAAQLGVDLLGTAEAGQAGERRGHGRGLLRAPHPGAARMVHCHTSHGSRPS
jgi:hypothetical protein